MIQEIAPAYIWNTYEEREPQADKYGFYRLRFDDVTVNTFFNMNEGDAVTVNSIK